MVANVLNRFETHDDIHRVVRQRDRFARSLDELDIWRGVRGRRLRDDVAGDVDAYNVGRDGSENGRAVSLAARDVQNTLVMG